MLHSPPASHSWPLRFCLTTASAVNISKNLQFRHIFGANYAKWQMTSYAM
jgi:hypothetical protein